MEPFSETEMESMNSSIPRGARNEAEAGPSHFYCKKSKLRGFHAKTNKKPRRRPDRLSH